MYECYGITSYVFIITCNCYITISSLSVISCIYDVLILWDLWGCHHVNDIHWHVDVKHTSSFKCVSACKAKPLLYLQDSVLIKLFCVIISCDFLLKQNCAFFAVALFRSTVSHQLFTTSGHECCYRCEWILISSWEWVLMVELREDVGMKKCLKM